MKSTLGLLGVGAVTAWAQHAAAAGPADVFEDSAGGLSAPHALQGGGFGAGGLDLSPASCLLFPGDGALSEGLRCLMQPEKSDAEEPKVQVTAAGQGGDGDEAQGGFRLPFLAEEARKAGYELPLPFGVGGAYSYLERDIAVHDVRIGIDGSPLQSASNFLNLGSRSHVNVALGRFDAFIFPFLDVYALAGYVKNDSTTTGTVTVPRPGPGGGMLTFPLTAKTTLDGFVGGFGATLAGGYKQVFAVLDANWSQTDIGFDDKFRAVVVSARVGWNGKIADTPVRLWTGATYWDTASTARSTVQVPGVGTVAFEADQGPANPWNMIFGGQVTIEKNFDLFLELGTNYDDMKMVTFGLTYRF